MTIQEEYKYFIENCTSTPKSYRNYSDFSRICNTIASINQSENFDIYSVTDVHILEKLIERIENNDDFQQYNKKGGNQYSNALQFYLRFLKARSFFKLSTVENSETADNLPLQQIYFGAPGTGKSHDINEVCAEYENYRTTFHPDTDYASFVGSYKPITEQVPRYTYMGAQAIAVKDEKGSPIIDTKITYRYVFQSFLKAYIAAWKEQENEDPKPVFLIIEEINRGNCAQIFGDIFQLLDRNVAGFSDYPIVADDDLAKELEKKLGKLNIVKRDEINNLYKGGKNVVGRVLNGENLLLPNNMYIWATMNTSDQSLFPIDSAFKRRWDWKYVKIKDAAKDYRIVFSNGNEYDWWQFVSEINHRIEGGEIQQEDKKLGYFFAKAKTQDGKNVITADVFLSKVIFYLCNDVFKDYGFEEEFFNDANGKTMTFSSYFDEFGNVDESRVERFVINLGLRPLDDANDIDENEQGEPQAFYNFISDGVKCRSITSAIRYILRKASKTAGFAEITSAVSQCINRDDSVLKQIDFPDAYQKEKGWNNKIITAKDGVAFVVTNQWRKEYIPMIKKLAEH